MWFYVCNYNDQKARIESPCTDLVEEDFSPDKGPQRHCVNTDLLTFNIVLQVNIP